MALNPGIIAKRKLLCALFVRPFPFVAPQSTVVVAPYGGLLRPPTSNRLAFTERRYKIYSARDSGIA
jgi:hypothetical protein